MSNKELYRQLCEREGDRIPLFLQHWWMEIVCYGKQWDVALSVRDGGVVQGAMPYLYGNKMGLRYVLQPQLTPYGGPWINYDGAGKDKVEYARRTVSDLIAQMEGYRPHLLVMHLLPSQSDWLPFYWRGFGQTTRYTYCFPDISDTRQLLSQFDKKERRAKIRQCMGNTTVHFAMTPADFAAFHARYWASRGRRNLLDRGFVERVCTAAVERGNGLIASLMDGDGCVVAARFVVFDSQCATSLMSAFDKQRYHNGYTETLLWGVLQRLSGHTRVYDFEGSMDPGIEHFNRSFGAVQTPYFEITKFRPKAVRWLLSLKK